MSRPNWEQYALMIAKVASARSEDPYQKVGACVLRNDFSVASVGYNGAPPKIEIDWSNRDERRARVIHAEANAFRYLKPKEGYLLASTLLPCRNCIQLAASYGIEKIIYSEEYEHDNIAHNLCTEFNIKLTKISLD